MLLLTACTGLHNSTLCALGICLCIYLCLLTWNCSLECSFCFARLGSDFLLLWVLLPLAPTTLVACYHPTVKRLRFDSYPTRLHWLAYDPYCLIELQTKAYFPMRETLQLHAARLYGRALNVAEVGVSCSGSGCFYSKKSKGFYQYDRSFLLSVEDPLDPSNDTARNSWNFKTVRQVVDHSQGGGDWGGAFCIG